VEERIKRRNKMEVATIIALVVAIPVILFPAAFVWYLNVGGMVKAAQKAKAKKAAQAKVTA
jgi:hypothetical protein